MIQTGVRLTLDLSREPRLAIVSLVNLCDSVRVLCPKVRTRLASSHHAAVKEVVISALELRK